MEYRYFTSWKTATHVDSAEQQKIKQRGENSSSRKPGVGVGGWAWNRADSRMSNANRPPHTPGNESTDYSILVRREEFMTRVSSWKVPGEPYQQALWPLNWDFCVWLQCKRKLWNKRLQRIKRGALSKSDDCKVDASRERSLLVTSLFALPSLTLHILEATLLNVFMCPWNFFLMLSLSSVCQWLAMMLEFRWGELSNYIWGHFRSGISSEAGLLSYCNKAAILGHPAWLGEPPQIALVGQLFNGTFKAQDPCRAQEALNDWV